VREGISVLQERGEERFGDDRVFHREIRRGSGATSRSDPGRRHGNIVVLNERECSIQRRHQKVIEEARFRRSWTTRRDRHGEQAGCSSPVPCSISRGRHGRVRRRQAQSFLLLEMNTRLQSSTGHRGITGLDLVELMIRVAAGERLPFTQRTCAATVWRIECRITPRIRSQFPAVLRRVVKFIPPPEIPGSARRTGMYEGGECRCITTR